MHRIVEQLRDALAQRSVAATRMNEQSSRAHTLFQLQLECTPHEAGRCMPGVRHSTLTFVDLAGSERVAKSGATGVQACALCERSHH